MHIDASQPRDVEYRLRKYLSEGCYNYHVRRDLFDTLDQLGIFLYPYRLSGLQSVLKRKLSDFRQDHLIAVPLSVRLGNNKRDLIACIDQFLK